MLFLSKNQQPNLQMNYLRKYDFLNEAQPKNHEVVALPQTFFPSEKRRTYRWIDNIR